MQNMKTALDLKEVLSITLNMSWDWEVVCMRVVNEPTGHLSEFQATFIDFQLLMQMLLKESSLR